MRNLILTLACLAVFAPVARAALSTTIDPVGGEQDGVEVIDATNVTTGVISLNDFQAYLDYYGSTAVAGVFDMEIPAAIAPTTVSDPGTDLVINSTTSLRQGRTDTSALAISGTKHGFFAADGTLTFTPPAGRRVTHFGLAAIDFNNAGTDLTLTATFSDGSTAMLSFDDAGANQDRWFGFVAPEFESITQVAVNQEEGGDWTVFDDIAFVTQRNKTQTWVYDVEARLGTSAPVNDGWIDNVDQAGWVVGNGPGGLRYVRNNNGGDNTIIRANNSGFSYAIPDSAPTVIFEADARITSGTSNFMEFGLSDGGATLFRIGMDFSNTNVFHVHHYDGVGGQVRTTGLAIPGGDFDGHFRFIIDTLANGGDGSGLLYFDDTLVVTVANLHLLDGNAPTLSGLDSLWLRSTSAFVGPGTFAITVIPAPAALPAGLAMIGLAVARRRRR